MNNIKEKLNTFLLERNQIACVTCYDASFSKILNDIEIDIVLVGDSLGMVIQGKKNTHQVTMDNILYHVACVAENKSKYLLMADMPKNSYENSKTAYSNAKKLLDNKVDIVKIEYKEEYYEVIEYLASKSIPVCAHIGLLPQYVSSKKDVRTYGKDKHESDKILNQAKKLDNLGVAMILLECVSSKLSKEITDSTNLPVIGIGSGTHCNGQVQVLYDLIGISDNPPKFSKDFLKEGGSIKGAVKKFYDYVKSIEN